MVSKTPHTTRMLWEPPTSVDGILDVYNVKVCEKSTTCDEQENLTGCVELVVSHAWLEFNSTADTSYCVFVSATARCGENLLTGTQAAQEIRTPLFELPEVKNLQLGEVGADTFALRWQRPNPCFDYYTIEVIDESTNGKSNVTCNEGAMINANQTSVTCDQIKSCANVTIRVMTHIRGPPQRSSTGATLKHVFLQGKAPPEVTHLKLVAAQGDNFTVSFQAPYACFDRYIYGAYINGSTRNVIRGKCKTRSLDYSRHTTNLH
ncbi:hypothetical protein MTO96_044765 [Rhipicephalus appendiculatus]